MLIDADPEELARSVVVLRRVAGETAGVARQLALDPRALVFAVRLLARAASLAALADRLSATAAAYRAADQASALIAPGGAIAALERAVSAAGPWLRESLAVSVVAHPDLPPAAPMGGAAGVLARVPPAGLRVDQVVTPAGRGWVVGIPGTSAWSPVAGRDPFDLTGDVRLMAGEASAGQAAVLAALRSVGVRRGEPVMLVGHSQGGLIAASLAARADVRREFAITQVVTSGAPIAFVDLPRSVNTLSIEHTDDPVPRADARANPVHAGWITVRAPAPASFGQFLAEPLRAHRADLYQRTAALVDHTPDPALSSWRAAAAPFLTADPARSWTFTVTRTS